MRLAAGFINESSNRTSMITVTNIELRERGTKAVFYISVFPAESAQGAVDFLKRRRPEMRAYLKRHGKLRVLPHVDVMLDEGERNRQRVDELLNE